MSEQIPPTANTHEQNATYQSNSEAQLAKEIASDEWSRVSPIAILYFFIKSLFFIVNNILIYTLPIFAFNFTKVKENILLIGAGTLALASILLIASVLRYLFYFYRLSADRVEIKQGLVQKSHMDLPFGKIQNVKIIQPFYYRFSDFAIIELDTAGSAQKEANIVAIRLPLAESFKRKVQSVVQDSPVGQTSQHDSINASTEATHSQEIILNQRSIKDLIIHGITNNRVWIFLGFLAPFYNAIAENIGNVLTVVGFDIASYLNYQSLSIGVFLLHVFSLVMLVMLVIVSFSIVGAIFVFYDYRLSKSEQRYIRRSGLLTKHEVSMKVSRIQRAVQQQDWLDILIGRVNLGFEQNSAGVPGANQASQINSASKLIVPSVTPEEADELTGDVFEVAALSKISYERISPRYIMRLLLYPGLLVFFIPMIFGLIGLTNENSNSVIIILGLVAIFIFIALACVLRWYRWGYASDENYVYVRKGFFGRDFIVFPISKIQQTKFNQTPLMRRSKLATAKFVLASGGIMVPYLPESKVTKIIDDALLLCARDKPAWM
jgi:putative membrane protein